MSGAPNTEVDTNALNTFAHGGTSNTSTLAHRALEVFPELMAAACSGMSMLSEGVGFHGEHMNTMFQTGYFSVDACSNDASLRSAANTIALQYSEADTISAEELQSVEPDPDQPFSEQSILQLVDVSASSAQTRATQQDVEDAFAPATNVSNPFTAALHSYTHPTPDPPDAQGEATNPPVPEGVHDPVADAIRAAELADAYGPSGVSAFDPGWWEGGSAGASYHLAHTVDLTNGEQLPVPADTVTPGTIERESSVQGRTGPELLEEVGDIVGEP